LITDERLILLSRKPTAWSEQSAWIDTAAFCTRGASNLPRSAMWTFMLPARQTPGSAGAADARFRAYASEVASVLGHADRVKPFEDYCTGLISAEGRKSVEPLAAVTAPERTAAQHQSLLHLVAQAGRTRRFCGGCASVCCRRSRVRSRSRRGSSTTRAIRRLVLGLDPRKGRHSCKGAQIGS
jgi:hypothetical protein